VKRLSYQIYLTIIACLIAVVVIAGVFWARSGGSMHARQAFSVAGELAAAALPSSEEPRNKQAAALINYAKRLNIDLALYTHNKDLITSTTLKRMPKPPRDKNHSGFMFQRDGPAWSIALPDGRWLVARVPRNRHRRPGLRLVMFLSAIALVVGLLAWPVVRGLTRRLERLQEGVEKLKAGDLEARVEVEGRDEIARLALSFNAAAERIKELVTAHKMLLANASHELRTPLSRIRLGIDMLVKNPGKARQDQIAHDIKELDTLIEEILLLSRLDARHKLDEDEKIDLLAMAAEEAAYYEMSVTTGSPVTINANPRLLRRMIRNLLDNAIRHGAPPISIDVREKDEEAILRVCDNGPGVMLSQKETIFEPFNRGFKKSSTAGTGLGLTLVAQIVKRHGGRIDIIENPKGGRLNCFEVALPKKIK